MKTRTYLRLSLLIPFLVWGACLLFFFLLSTFASSAFESDGPTLAGLILWPILFYVFGIIGWFLPYVLLALILLLLSFRSRAEVLLRIFALTPVAMAILIIVFLNILSLGSPDWNIPSAAGTGDFFGSDLWFAMLTLIWGYICVGIGFGVYKILEQLNFIRDQVVPTAISLSKPA